MSLFYGGVHRSLLLLARQVNVHVFLEQRLDDVLVTALHGVDEGRVLGMVLKAEKDKSRVVVTSYDPKESSMGNVHACTYGRANHGPSGRLSQSRSWIRLIVPLPKGSKNLF